MIKYISFDLWLTLIKSNPLFKPERAKLIALEYNPLNLKEEEILKRIYDIDKLFDRYNESKGRKLDSKLMYCYLLECLGYAKASISNNMLEEIKTKADQLFLTYPPIPLNNSIEGMLAELKNRGYRLTISSNTGFIDGSVLMQVFERMNWTKYFDFYVFSDEIRTSKPAPDFFQKVHNNMNETDKKEVLHIGDNFKTDYLGATNFGFHALLITNEYNIKTINSFLNEIG